MTEIPEVLVVGAGPTGLTAAMELSRLGVSVRIVDRAAQPSQTSRALGVQARTLELLRVRGVGEDMLRLGNRATATALYARGRRIAGLDFARMTSDHNFILLLAQSETERLLTEQLGRQGVKVDRGVEVIGLEQRPADVQVRLCTGDGAQETVTAGYVIAADGAHSPIRTTLGLPFEGRSLPHHYVLGDLHLAGEVPEDQLSIFLAPNGFLAVFPMGEGRFRFMATDPDGLTGESPEPDLAAIQALYDRVSPVPAELHDLNWSSRFRIHSRHMTSLRHGRVFFGGDAAHVHSPAGGQGMNAGIQDMINLAWKLAMVLDGRAREPLLDTYGSDRLPVIAQLVSMTERATAIFNSTSPLLHATVTRLAPLLLARPAVQDKAVPRLGQIAASYRGAPLAAGGGRAGALRAGDRVPDVEVGTAAGDRHRLYDLLDLTRLTLVTSTDDAPAGYGDLIAVRQVSDGVDGWWLIRPDGYLAAAGPKGDQRVMTRWLSRWFS
ncbi:FAD-dependent monooxygenase [Mycolicibacterium flavescens]|uniref:2-polyprenyl-6-methoxyphenol hydroxylase n=1 Tax=Mycolicibacterium flavescens TaxID=1776 RepID=A0A1E3RMA8_MYCFV|nr:FAD-dependent oxidoreductase [Mycolicibacterium flavescens]MCV7279052.1 FAD-dependent monooxygenase [Mycolicibacterium flavescens]ODQ90537.1 2-polyprenyl-6-methoxyphenol hydroxylase [Mycolicibacterium flavescens]